VTEIAGLTTNSGEAENASLETGKDFGAKRWKEEKIPASLNEVSIEETKTKLTFPPREKFRLGLAFEGGGAKGAYEVGVWRALIEEQLTPYVAAVSGTSIGALNAAFFSYGSYEKARDIWLNLGLDDLLGIDEDAEVLIRDVIHSLLRDGIFSRTVMNTVFAGLDLTRQADVNCYVTCLPLPKKASGLLAALEHAIGRTVPEELMFLLNSQLLIGITRLTSLSGVLAWTALRRLRKLYDLSKVPYNAVSYINLNDYRELQRRQFLNAASAIPIVYPVEEVDGKFYSDAGMNNNQPIFPLFHYAQCDAVLAIYCRPYVELEKIGPRLWPVLPVTDTHGIIGTFDFRHDTIVELMEEGYRDGKLSLAMFKDYHFGEGKLGLRYYEDTLARNTEPDFWSGLLQEYLPGNK